uniref:Uncharacterized protein n=1 Tax=Brassica oleracea var. oleracea TaxID=109376 RepID=A0A0D3AU14_BRAOL
MCGMASSPIGSTPVRPKRSIRARLLQGRRIKMLERAEVLPSLSELFKMTHATSDGVFVDPASVAPKKRGRTVGIGSVNEVARASSSYISRRDEETSQMKARMDSMQVRLDFLEDLLDVMAVENPTMQKMLSERRAAIGLPVRDPE